MAVRDPGGDWTFRNPRTGHWTTGDMFERGRGKRHRGAQPSKQAIDDAREVRVRVKRGGEEFYLRVRKPRGEPIYSSDYLSAKASP